MAHYVYRFYTEVNVLAGKRRNTRNKNSIKSSTNADITGVLLIFFGIFAFISVYIKDKTGIIGEFMSKLLFAVIGLGAYVLPFIIIIVGVSYIAKRGQINFTNKFYGIILFILNSLLFITFLNIDKYYTNGQVVSGIKYMYNSSDVFHGGAISLIIDIPLLKLFGNGSYILFVFMYIVSFILISNKSLGDIFEKIKYNKENRDDNTKQYIKPDINDESDNDNKKENFIKSTMNKLKDLKKQPEDIDETLQEPYADRDIKIEDNSARKESNENIGKEFEREIEDNSGNNSSAEYVFPRVDMLNENKFNKLNKSDKKELLQSAEKLKETLNSFGVDAKVVQVTKGPSVTRFELQPNAGVKVSRIVNLSDDIALNLAASAVRIEAPIPGKAALGIEVPNVDLTPVFLREVIESNAFADPKHKLSFCLGKDIGGNCVVGDLSKMPHVLIAGATGSGKSVCINALIIGLLYKYKPEDVKLLMIDPKVVELSVYNGIPHLLIPVVTDPKKAAGALNWAVNEMTKRYKMFADNGVRNIEGYNDLYKKGKVQSKLPWIVIIIDELSDLMMVCANDIEDYIGRLAQMARAAGMHLVIATQRPSVDVITGVIKANIPSRISFAVSSQIDSRTILDSSGAEKLLGKGDMLFYPVGEAKPLRIQGAFISEEEVEKVVDFIKNERQEPMEYKEEIIEEINNNKLSSEKSDDEEDELLNEAINIVVDSGNASTSFIQRKFRIGYNRAARIMEQLEDRGVISKRDGSKPRNILITKDEANKLT